MTKIPEKVFEILKTTVTYPKKLWLSLTVFQRLITIRNCAEKVWGLNLKEYPPGWETTPNFIPD